MTSVRVVLGALLVAGLVAWATGGTGGRLTASAQQVPVGGSCDRLSAVALPNTTIALAQTVSAGQFAPPVAPGRGGAGRGPAPALVAPAVPGRVTLASANLGLGLDGGRKRPQFSELPGFCRVAATVKPTPSSDIRMEVWLPMSGWNGRFRGTVANGMGGNIAYASMAAALRDGYAVASSDTRRPTPFGCRIPRR
jgi:feruloyl esterase